MDGGGKGKLCPQICFAGCCLSVHTVGGRNLDYRAWTAENRGSWGIGSERRFARRVYLGEEPEDGAKGGVGSEGPLPAVIHQAIGGGDCGHQLNRAEDFGKVNFQQASHARFHLNAIFHGRHERSETDLNRIDIRQQVVERKATAEIGGNTLQKAVLPIEKRDQGTGLGLPGGVHNKAADFTGETDGDSGLKRRHSEHGHRCNRGGGRYPEPGCHQLPGACHTLLPTNSALRKKQGRFSLP